MSRLPGPRMSSSLQVRSTIRRLAFLYTMASRVLDGWTSRGCGLAYTQCLRERFSTVAPFELPFGVDGLIGSVYLAIGQPERYVEMVPSPARTRA